MSTAPCFKVFRRFKKISHFLIKYFSSNLQMNSCKVISKTDASIYLQFWNYSANLRLKVQYHFLLVSDCHYFATPAGNKTSCEKCSESLLHRKWQKGRNVVKSNFLFTFSDRLYKQTCGRRGKPLQSAGRCTHPTTVPGKNQFFLASLLLLFVNEARFNAVTRCRLVTYKL